MIKITIEEPGKEPIIRECEIFVLNAGTANDNGLIDTQPYAHGDYRLVSRIYLGLGAYLHNCFTKAQEEPKEVEPK